MKTVVIAWGRLNPPTSGHELLINKVRTIARLEKGDPMVYLSHSQDSKKNPFDYNTKVKYAQKAFGNIVQRSSANTIFKVLGELEKKYQRLVLVVGSDRVAEFRSLFEKYGKDYSFEKLEVVSAGERDPDADDVTGMSASKMREMAVKDNFDDFKSGLPKLLQRDAKKVYDDLRIAMKIN